jgi:3-hydroxyisobutyrate dehydrogenase
MVRTQELVAVLGIGAMGHGMATSALRAGIPTIVWNREPAATRDLAGLGADVAETAAVAARRAAIVVTMVTDADAVMSIARDQGMLAALAPGADLGADEHHRRGRDRPRRGHGGCRAS